MRGKQDTGKEFQSEAVRVKKLEEYLIVLVLETDSVWMEESAKCGEQLIVRSGETSSDRELHSISH